MKIEVASATSKGSSRKTTFDSALKKIDMHNYNLVELSSVVPPSADIETVESIGQSFTTGSVVSVVSSVDYSEPESNESAYAELYWNQSEFGSGYFIESEDGKEVTDEQLDRMESNRSQDFQSKPSQLASISSNTDSYNCSLVIAVFGRIRTEYKENPHY